ncbi:hypothetical protein Q1W73_16625 [Asticcacaulis sp. ZE23SCel15]|uniref:hypothetical protein n=1 Tax=Asticcacaulis sp. ZE23SCel15 TaxID=3059027 RepID=UPI00265ED877|nr:hypothetical protein [Asticcacaulis sp. ZE23SCel15]WKL57269.1 hypothetical protein Q1W73_16625 [Asticcacaulis sp. ZE23SCel15]
MNGLDLSGALMNATLRTRFNPPPSKLGAPLNPAVMALRCVRKTWLIGKLTEGKIYSANFTTSFAGQQYVWVTDDTGAVIDVPADRFEPVNPARRPLFKHLRGPETPGH